MSHLDNNPEQQDKWWHLRRWSKTLRWKVPINPSCQSLPVKTTIGCEWWGYRQTWPGSHPLTRRRQWNSNPSCGLCGNESLPPIFCLRVCTYSLSGALQRALAWAAGPVEISTMRRDEATKTPKPLVVIFMSSAVNPCLLALNDRGLSEVICLISLLMMRLCAFVLHSDSVQYF